MSVRILDALFPAAEMGFLLLFRRQGVLYGNLLQFGCSQSIQKFYTNEPDAARRFSIWHWLNRLVFIMGCGLAVILFFWSDSISSFTLGETSYLTGWSLGLYTIGMATGYMACSSWLSEFQLTHANLVDFANSSLIFISCVLLFHHVNAFHLAFIFGLSTLIISILSIMHFYAKHLNTPAVHIPLEPAQKKTMFGFSLSRGVSTFLDNGILTIGPWLLVSQPEEAGFLTIAYTILRLGQSIIVPGAQVIALRSISYRYQGRDEVKKCMVLAALGLGISLLAIGIYQISGPGLMHAWLPNSASGVLYYLDALIWFLPGYCVFYAVRNQIEVSSNIPWNLIIYCASLVAFLVTWHFRGADNREAVLYGSEAMLSTLLVASIIALMTFWRETSGDEVPC
ncbi:hypothetical protein E3226_006135 [Legionella geestiana]|nr:hypothetical protein E3226_006135 [Legionella geestiana]